MRIVYSDFKDQLQLRKCRHSLETYVNSELFLAHAGEIKKMLDTWEDWI